MALVIKNPPANAGDVRDSGLISRLGRSPGGRHGNPLQYSCLENPMDRGAWWATVHTITKSRTWLKWLRMHTCIHRDLLLPFCSLFCDDFKVPLFLSYCLPLWFDDFLQCSALIPFSLSFVYLLQVFELQFPRHSHRTSYNVFWADNNVIWCHIKAIYF